MPSLITTERSRQLDQAIFYLAFGGALAAAVFTVGAAANRADLGVTGAELTLAGTAVSWWMRRWPAPRALGVGLLLGVAAGIVWLLRLELSGGLREEADATLESGMAMAFYMSVLLVIASYALVRVEVAAFSLVPGLSALGLAAGQGDELVARVGFTVYLPLALLAVGYAMLTTGAVAGAVHRLPEADPLARGGPRWQVRHWPIMGGAILVVLLLAQVLYLPLEAWASAHRWQLITAISTPAAVLRDSPDTAHEPPSTYRVGKGPIHPDDTSALTIVGDYAAYWRGEVYDVYNGASWGQSGAVAPRVELAAGAERGAFSFSTPPKGRPTATYHVTAETGLPLIFYAPGEVYRVVPGQSLEIPADARVVANGYGVVRVPGAMLYPGSTYEVTAGSFESAAGRPTPTGRADDRYLRLPFEVRRAAELARQVAGREPSAERKMLALVAYLQTHCAYSLDAPAVPLGSDAVEYFLFRQRTGYCDLFASALAVMGRAVGVPTRLVTGYAFATASDSDKRTYTFTRADAHAWVEAFLPASGGWTTVDATPAAKAATASRTWLQRFALQAEMLWRTRPVVAIGYGLIALLLALAFAYAVRSLLQYRSLEALPAATRNWRGEMTRVYLRLCRLLRRRGYPRHAAQTPLEYLAFVEQHWVPRANGAAALPWVRTLTEEFVIARYGPGPVTEGTARAAHDTLTALRRALSRRG